MYVSFLKHLENIRNVPAAIYLGDRRAFYCVV